MNNLIAIILLLYCVLSSCDKDSTADLPSGIYTETSPVRGRSQMNFISAELVVRSEPGYTAKDTFRFSILGDKIWMIPAWDNQYSGQEFEFQKIDDRSFRIENLYPGIPEAPKSYITYKR